MINLGLKTVTVLAAALMGISLTFAATAGTSYDVTAPDEWDRADSVVADMAKDWPGSPGWTAEEGHEITYGVVEDADEPGTHYFATTRDNGAGGTQLSVFRYDSASYGFQRLWRDDNASDAAWHVVGYDNGKVVLSKTAGTYDRGACGEPLVADGATLHTVPDNFSESWDAGLTDYSAQQADLDEVRSRQSDCEGAGSGGE